MSRGGVALPVLLLVMLGLTALAHGALLLSGAALRATRVGASVGQARLAAESAVSEAVGSADGWSGLAPPLWDAPVIGEGTLGPRARYRVRLRSLGPEHRLVEAEGWVEPGEARRRAGRLAWILDPTARLGAAAAVAEVGGRVRVGADAELSGEGMDRLPEGWPPESCAPYARVVDSLYPLGRLPATAALPPPPLPEPALGLLSVDTLLARAGAEVSGAVTPAPESVDGSCVAGPSNWGRPSDPAGVCGDRFPLVAAAGSLVVDGGEGQGVLVVDGDLRVEGGARLAGVVLVAGGLVVADSSTVEGVVQVGSDLELREGARLLGRGCPVLRALDGAPSLRSPVLPPGGSWVSPF